MSKQTTDTSLTILPLARAIRKAVRKGVTIEQIETIVEVTAAGALDDHLDAYDEADVMARAPVCRSAA